MKVLVCESSPTLIKNLQSKIQKSKLVTELHFCTQDRFITKSIEQINPNLIFLNPLAASKIRKKHIVPKRSFALIIKPNQTNEISPAVLKFSDAIIKTESTELEFQILIAALLVGKGKDKMISKMKTPKGKTPKLTVREIEILHFLSRGKSDQQISQELKISLPTVKTHERRIFAKLRVKNRTHGVAQGIRWNII